MTDFEQFRSADVLQLDVDDRMFEEPVAEVSEHLSGIGAARFMEAAENIANYNGMNFTVVGGGKDRSSEAAILMPGTYANDAWPHILARAEAISYMAAQAGLRDSQGNLVPVVVTGSPSMRSRFGLDDSERSDVRRGNYDSIAERHQGLLRGLGRTAVGMVASSQATALAAPFVAELPASSFGEGIPVVMAEPPHGKHRIVLPVVSQLVGFAREGAAFKAHLKAEDIDVINEIFASGKASPDFERGIAKEHKDNLAIVRGFARGKLGYDLSRLALSGSRTTVVHGSDSLVSRQEDITAAFDEAVKRILDVTGETGQANNLRRLELSDANHSLMDRVGRFAVISAANLTTT